MGAYNKHFIFVGSVFRNRIIAMPIALLCNQTSLYSPVGVYATPETCVRFLWLKKSRYDLHPDGIGNYNRYQWRYRV